MPTARGSGSRKALRHHARVRIHIAAQDVGVLSCEEGAPWDAIATAIAARLPELAAAAWAGPMRLGTMHCAGAWPLVEGCIVTGAPSSRAATPPPAPRLLDSMGMALTTLDRPVVISRMPVDVSPGTSLLILDDAAVDAPHAGIEQTASGWEVTDLDSRNGTSVQVGRKRRRITRAVLAPGSVVTVGRTSLSVDALASTAPESAHVTLPADPGEASRGGHPPTAAARPACGPGLRIGADEHGQAMCWDPDEGPLVVVAASPSDTAPPLETVRLRAKAAGVDLTVIDLGGASADPAVASRTEHSMRTTQGPHAIGLSSSLALSAPRLIAMATMTVLVGETDADVVHAVVGGAPDAWARAAGAALSRSGARRSRMRIDHPDEARLPPVAWIDEA